MSGSAPVLQLGPIAAVPVPELTSGAQLFRCVPYSCTMLARACVERQAKAALGLDAITLLKCKGCELGADVKARAADVVIEESSLLRGARANGHHRGGALREKLRGAKFNPAPAAGEVRAPIAPPPVQSAPTVLTAPSVVESPKKNEGIMPRPADLNGKEIAGVKVLHQLDSAEKGTLWRARFPCGHEEDLLGSILTAYARNGNTRHCKHCRAAGKDKPRARPKRTEGASPTEAHVAARKGPARPKPTSPHGSIPSRPSSAAHEFPLRRDFTARLELPSDLSKSDVTRLARWLEVIAFDDGAE